MIGIVDDEGRALLTLDLIVDNEKPAIPIDAWIDTGFNGDLVIPLPTIRVLGLDSPTVIDAILADGAKVVLDVFVCFIHWLGEGWRSLRIKAKYR